MLGVAPSRPQLPSGLLANGGLAPQGADLDQAPAVSKPFDQTADEIQQLILSMFDIYVERNPAVQRKLYRRAFTENAVFDLPPILVHGADNMRMFSRLMGVPFWKIEVTPKLVTVQMLNTQLGRIDVDASLRLFPRFSFFPYTLVVPEFLEVFGTWTIIAKGDDDRILSVTETLHNLPRVPTLIRRLVTGAVTTAGSLVGL